jgi:hypothetical protein
MGATIWAVAVATAGLPESEFSGGGVVVLLLPLLSLLLLLLLVERRSDVETVEEGAAAIIGTEPGCWVPSAPVPVPFPPVFTGAESVAKELGDCRTL